MAQIPSLISRTYLHQHLLLLCIYPLHHYCKAIFIHDPSSGKGSTILRFSPLVSPGSSISCNSPINSLSGPNHAHHNNYITAPYVTGSSLFAWVQGHRSQTRLGSQLGASSNNTSCARHCLHSSCLEGAPY